MQSILLFMLPIDASVAAWRCGFARVVLWWWCDGFGQHCCVGGVRSRDLLLVSYWLLDNNESL